MMANQGYVGTDYDKWAKLYGIGMGQDGKYIAPEKTNEMSDTDYQIGQTLYRAYLENQRLDSEYGKGKQALADNKREAEISADVTLQRMQKYLPQQLVKQGLYGTGVSEDAYLKLQNQYQKSVSDAAKSYNDGLSALESVYQQNKNSVWEQANTGVNTVLENEATKSLANYNEAYAALEPSVLTSADDVDTILAQYKGKMSETHYSNLERYAKTVKEDIIEASEFNNKGKTTEASFTNSSGSTGFDSGDNFEIKLGTETYKVQSGGEATGNVVAWATAQELNDGSVFMYDGDVYIYKGESVYRVEKRYTHTDDDSDYAKLKKALTGKSGAEKTADNASSNTASNTKPLLPSYYTLYDPGARYTSLPKHFVAN